MYRPWWFKNFCKGDKSLEDKEHSDWPSEVDNDQLKAITKADPLTTTLEFAEEPNINHSMVIWHLKQIGKVKRIDKWVPHEPTANQKPIILKCHLLFYATTTNHFSIGLGHAPKRGFYMTTGNDQLSGWIKNKLKALTEAKLAPKKCHGYSLVACCQSDPVQPSGSSGHHYT